MNRRQIAEANRMNKQALKLYARLGRTPRCADIRDWGPLDRTLPNEQLLPKQWPAECGTESGWKRHRVAGEQPCAACLEAHNSRYRKGGGRGK